VAPAAPIHHHWGSIGAHFRTPELSKVIMVTRRSFLLRAVGGAAALAANPALALASAPVPITVYKSPTCGCCKEWVTYMEQNGFKVTSFDVDDVSPMKKRFGVPDNLISCHTGYVGGYAVEGHVPAPDIQRMLKEKPKIAGIAAPGMPHGSPGMETGRVDRYDVIAFTRDGKTSVFAKH
jgi:hypothetical protein